MTTAPAASRGLGQTTAAQRAGWFGGGFGGMILGGLLFGGMFGLLFGTGFGGFGGFLALLVQVVIIGLLLSWFGRRRQQPAMAGAGAASPYQARQDWQPGGGNAQPRRDASNASRRAGKRDEIGTTHRDLATFEQRLGELQNAYSREDYDGLRRITTPEMMGYLGRRAGQQCQQGPVVTRCSTSSCSPATSPKPGARTALTTPRPRCATKAATSCASVRRARSLAATTA